MSARSQEATSSPPDPPVTPTPSFAASAPLRQQFGSLEELCARIEALETELTDSKKNTEQLNEELAAQRDQFQAILDAVPGGVSWINTDLVYLGINERLAHNFGLSPSEFVGQRIGFLKASPNFEAFVLDFLGNPANADAREVEMSVGDEQRIYLLMAQKYRGGQSALFVGIDITDRKRAEEQLRHEAFYDTLTGLPNRALLLERLNHALDFARSRSDYLFAVLFLDFDGFKTVNDSLGHNVGDMVLNAVARRLESSVRGSDTVARLGGDEYVLLLAPIEGLSDATQIAERVRRNIALPFTLEGQEIFLTVSIGIVLNASSYSNPNQLLRDADIAMYRAKASGRNRYEIFDGVMHQAAMARLQLETDLHQSLDKHTDGQAGVEDFVLHYQPIMDLKTGTLHSFEALLRWQRPRSGFTWPDEFIPTAEDTGLIVSLDRWVLGKACRQMKTWLDEFGPEKCPQNVSVNFSSRQFSYPDLVEFVAQTLDKTKLPPQYLNIEITESAIMENIESVAILLRGLERLGVKVGLDDFGTGYSSLSYLHRLPLQTLKIDRSFIPEAATIGSSHSIVSAIVSLAHNLDMTVVAEGVETSEQLEMLLALDCDLAQGHLFHRALVLEDAYSVIRSSGHAV